MRKWKWTQRFRARDGRTLCWCLSLLVANGCYSYRPVEMPRPGMEVRARLTNEAAIRRSSGLDEPVVHLDGRVVDAEPAALTLDVLVARSMSMFQDITIRDTVRVEMNELQSVVARELSVGRTILFTAAVGAGIAAVVSGISSVVGGSEDGGPDPGPQVARVPVLGVRMGGGGFRLQLPFR